MPVVLYENIEIGNIGPTPSSFIVDDDSTLSIAKKSILDFGKSRGLPIAYKQEQFGQLIQHILPIFNAEDKQVSTSSKSTLQLHTETAFHPYKPSFVLLLCLRGDSQAITTYADIEDIAPKLKTETVELLQKPFFTTRVDESFRTNGGKDIEFTLPILRKNKSSSFDITYDEYFMRGVTRESQAALDELSDVISESTKEIILKSGDLLVIDNKTTIHGRKPFVAKYDGTDRWVLRLLVIDYAIPYQHLNKNTIITNFGKF